MDFVRYAVCRAYLKEVDRTLQLIGKDWEILRDKLPEHNQIGQLILEEIPAVDIQRWYDDSLWRALYSTTTSNTVRVGFEDGAVLWLWIPPLYNLLRRARTPTLDELRQSFPYLKEKELLRLKDFDFKPIARAALPPIPYDN